MLDECNSYLTLVILIRKEGTKLSLQHKMIDKNLVLLLVVNLFFTNSLFSNNYIRIYLLKIW